MIINTGDLIEKFKNLVVDVYLKDGTVHLGCDMSSQSQDDFVTVIIDNVIFVHPIDTIHHMEFYDAGI